jgi:nucleoside-diphosphate-sugar epimerase
LDDRVVVLGATGYVGRAVVDALRVTGRPVVMVARRPPASVPSATVFIGCDAGDARQLAIVVGPERAVVNAMGGTPSAMVEGARNLAAVVKNGAKARIVHVSSLAVFGQLTGTFDETTEPVPIRRHTYGAGKLVCESVLRSVGAVVLRPGCIYGAGAPIWCDRIGRLLLARRLGWLGHGGGGWCNAVHVDDVAWSVVRALDVRLEKSGVHHVLAPERLSWNDYFRRFAVQLGIELPRIGRVQLQADILLVSPFLHLFHFAGDIITPTMARAFRCRALPVVGRPLLGPDEFRPLDDGLAEAAAMLQCRGMGDVVMPRLLASAMP